MMLNMRSRKIGQFRIGRELIEDGVGPLVFAGLFPIEVRYRFDYDGLEVMAFGECFAEVPEGEIAPFYQIECITESREMKDEHGKYVRREVVGVRFHAG